MGPRRILARSGRAEGVAPEQRTVHRKALVAPTTAPPLPLDPYAPAFHVDPYPTYAWLREHDPVHHNPQLGFYALSRYDDVLAATRDHDTFVSGYGTTLEMMGVDYQQVMRDRPIILFTDPPYHEQLRHLVSRAFTPRSIASLHPAIEARVGNLLDALAERGQADLVQDFATPLPMHVIFEMLSVPEDDRRQVREWVDRSLDRVQEPPFIPEHSFEAQRHALRYYDGLVDDRSDDPAPRDDHDMVGTLLTAELELEDGTTRTLSHGETLGFIGMLAGAGNETVTKLISNALVALHRFPDQRRLVLDDLDRVPALVEEALRYQAPSQYQGRTTSRAVELHGVTIPQGSKVALLTGSANRDPSRFDDPDRFDVERPNAMEHLSFGTGIHFCLGAALARIEARTALRAFLERFPDYAVDESGIEHVHSSNVHGYEHVPVTVA